MSADDKRDEVREEREEQELPHETVTGTGYKRQAEIEKHPEIMESEYAQDVVRTQDDNQAQAGKQAASQAKDESDSQRLEDTQPIKREVDETNQ